MTKYCALLSTCLLLSASLAWQCSTARAASVGVDPCDGVTMLVKEFSVPANTSITGLEFQNNDSRTVFPEVVLIRGSGASMSEGTMLRTASNVSEASGGWVQVTWTTVVTTSGGDTYRVGVRFPEGTGKLATGNGPGIGAVRVASPSGSFVAGGENGELTATLLDLTMNLVTSRAGKANLEPRTPSLARTFLGSIGPNPFNPSTTIEFGVAEPMNTQLTIYDVSGRPVRALVRERVNAGTYGHVWNGRSDAGHLVAAGVYWVRFSAGGQLAQKKIILVK